MIKSYYITSMKYFVRLMILMFCFNTLVFAGNDLITVVKEKYSKITTMQGSFTQTVCSEFEGTCRQFEGTFSIKRPYYSRLEVKSPEKQLIITDSANMYYYFVNKKKVYLQSASSSINFFKIFDLLINDAARFQITRSNDYTILIYQKDTLGELNMFEDLKLFINNKTNLIEKFSFTDFSGSDNEFALTGIKVNLSLPSKLFKFTIPKGAEVIKY